MSRVVFWSLVIGAVVVPAGCGRTPPASPFGSLEGGGEDVHADLVFPPRNDNAGWLTRAPIPGLGGSAWQPSSDLRVVAPELDDKGHFKLTGHTLRFEFDDAVGDPSPSAAPPIPVFTPKVAGRTHWVDRSILEFQADAPFDPDKDYSVEISPFTSQGAKKLAKPFRATFRATPELSIAGKTINYVPKAGEHRVIYTRPTEDAQIGPGREIIVIFDQATDLTVAKEIVQVTTEQGVKMALNFRHPTGDTFEGIKVDPRVIALVTFAVPPPPGAVLTLTTKDRRPSAKPRELTLTVPARPKFKALACSECSVQGLTARGPANNWGVQLEYTNSVGYHDAKAIVRVTPTPKNFSAEASGDGIYVHGSWEPSTTYAIRVQGGTDRFGFALPAVNATFQALPRSANTVLREGVMLLDEAHAKSFPLTTRNVDRGELQLWPVAPGREALEQAIAQSNRRQAPTDTPITVAYSGKGAKNMYGVATLDLSSKLERGRAYLMRAVTKVGANGAAAPDSRNNYGERSLPLVYYAKSDALGAHLHTVGDKSIVQVYRLANGEPVGGAQVNLSGEWQATDGSGSVVVSRKGNPRSLTLRHQGVESVLPLGQKPPATASSLYPELTNRRESEGDDEDAEVVQGPIAADASRRGFLVLDKGIYRPEGTLHIKAMLRKREGTGLVPHADVPVRVHVKDPSGTDVADVALRTNALGFVHTEVVLPPGAQSGRYPVVFETDESKRVTLDQVLVRVAEYETPKFKVDVSGTDQGKDLAAKVSAQYMFGAPMNDAQVSWSLRSRPGRVPAGKLSDAGFVFDRQSEYDDWGASAPADSAESFKNVTGEGKLAADGTYVVTTPFGPLGQAPRIFTFEADVTDASYRHIANRVELLKFPYPRIAGLRLDNRASNVGPVRVELGAVDTSGRAVMGANVEARLERIEWKRTAQRGESGYDVETWRPELTQVGQCSVVSAGEGRACEVSTRENGSYRLTAWVDGHPGGSVVFYAWGGSGSSSTPNAGRKIPVFLDKATYRAGDTAKVVAGNPYPEAIALFAVQQGGLITHRSKRVRQGLTTFDIPISAALAPYAHAEVTFLPIGVVDSGYRVGAVRVPVGLAESKLDLALSTNKKTYDVGETVELNLDVKRGNAAIAGADVTLAIVDEATLRMTNHHVRDPLSQFLPPLPLDFASEDTRDLFFKRLEKAHVPGGGGEADQGVGTRKDFVETLAWLPNLVADANGRVRATVKLKDNLTEFRVMATVVDGQGRAGIGESSFHVSRALLVEPILPQFAVKGDRLEVGAMVHNNTEETIRANVNVIGQGRDVTLAPKSHVKVTVPFVAESSRAMRVSVSAGGKERDAVERELRVQTLGVEEHPTLSGAFRERRNVALEIPDDALFDSDAALTVRTGAALYPELGQRLGYLLDYPHGCVEQTTSGTLPLLSATTLLPWTGVSKIPPEEIRKRIRAGVDRLATMRTAEGGLAYWPGGTEPHVYGSAYAARALLRAKVLGIEVEGLLPSVLEFLAKHLANEKDPNLAVTIAEVLAQGGKLPQGAADGLYEKRDKLDTFGLASLALALAQLPKQEDRVQALVSDVEASFDESGVSKRANRKKDYDYFGSNDRDRAQTLIALVKLRRNSPLAPSLAARLARKVDGYATQSVAWSLVALGDFVGQTKADGGFDISVHIEGLDVPALAKLSEKQTEAKVPLALLRGKRVIMVFEGEKEHAAAFSIEARYTRPFSSSPRAARRAPRGPSIYRVYTDDAGKPLDLNKVKAGTVVRVALRAEFSDVEDWRMRYFALVDRFPAGFEPMMPDLATVAKVPDLDAKHPFFKGFSEGRTDASHVDIRADRVNLYFDSLYVSEPVFATYLLRATTPGQFALPAARGELMYEADSEGFSEGGSVTIIP